MTDLFIYLFFILFYFLHLVFWCTVQAAHVGVGLSGQEGLQAASASDYSIAQVPINVISVATSSIRVISVAVSVLLSLCVCTIHGTLPPC